MAMTISKIAKEAGINIETVRFYERNKIMPVPKRSESGYRIYNEEDIKRLHFIQIAKKHGFTLKEIKELLDLKVDSKTTCDDVRKIAEEKIEEVELKLLELSSIKDALHNLALSCHSGGPVSECPILEEFENVK